MTQGLTWPLISFSELPLLFHLPTESSPSDPSVSTASSYPTLSEVFGRKRKKRTSIETNIRLTLEKRFQDVSGPTCWERVDRLRSWGSGREGPAATRLGMGPKAKTRSLSRHPVFRKRLPSSWALGSSFPTDPSCPHFWGPRCPSPWEIPRMRERVSEDGVSLYPVEVRE